MDEEPVCSETNQGRRCTRPLGHQGFHLAKTEHGSFSWNHMISPSGRWKGART